MKGEELLILLIKNKDRTSDLGGWSLPGGIIDENTDASTRHTAVRKLRTEIGIKSQYLEQLKSYSENKPNAQSWNVSVAYIVLMPYMNAPSNNAAVHEAIWVSIDKLNKYTPFSAKHKHTIKDAIRRLRNKTRYSLLPAYCLEETFTFNEFHRAVETILGHKVQKKSLYRRIEDSGALEKTGLIRGIGTKRAALYRTNEKTRDHTFERNLSRS